MKIRSGLACWIASLSVMACISGNIALAEKTTVDAWSPSFTPGSVDFTGLKNANFNDCSRDQIKTGVDQLTRMLGDALDPAFKNSESARSLKAFSLETPCPAAGDAIDPKEIDCKALDSKEEKKAALQRAFDRQAAYACQLAKVQAVDAELKCLTQESATLAQNITMLGAQYSSYIEKWNGDLMIGMEVFAARQKQGEELNARLNGDPVSGKEGLRAVQARLEGLVRSEFASKLTQYEQSYQSIENQQRNFLQMKESRKIEVVSDCVRNRRSGNYKCDAKAAPVGFMEYLLCRYKQEAQRTSSGQADQSEVAKARAASQESDLRAILEQLLPQTVQTAYGDASKGQGMQLNTTNPYQLTETNYSSVIDKALGKYNQNGINVAGSLKQVMSGCYGAAKAKVASEENIPGLMLGQAKEAIKMQENQFKSAVVADMNVYRNEYGKAMASLTGRHLPPPIEARCVDGTPPEQIGCMKSLRSNIEGLLAGSTGGSLLVQTIKSTSSKVPDVCIGDVDGQGRCLGCAGVNGCLTAMEGRSRHLKNEVDTIDRKIKEFKSAANMQLQNNAKQTAAMLSSSSQYIDGRLQKINAILSQIGIKGVNIPRVEPTQFQDNDENGILDPPADPYSLIGGMTTPPALKLDGNSFGEGMEGITEKRGEIEAGYANSRGVTTELNQRVASCVLEKKKEFQNKLAGFTGEWNGTNGCTRVKEVCDKSQTGSMATMLSSINEILSDSSLDADAGDLSGYKRCSSNPDKSEASCAMYTVKECSAEDLKKDPECKAKGDQNDYDKCMERVNTCSQLAQDITKRYGDYKRNVASEEESSDAR